MQFWMYYQWPYFYNFQMSEKTCIDPQRCRKKLIMGTRKIPQPGIDKLVWIANKEGNTLIAYEADRYGDDEQVLQLCEKVILPSINRQMANMWSLGQSFNSNSELFRTIRSVIKIAMGFLLVSLLAILFVISNGESSFFMISVLFMVWVICCCIGFYSFFKKFINFQADSKMIASISSLLQYYNQQVLINKGFILKSDPYLTWLCLINLNHVKSSVNVDIDHISSDMDYIIEDSISNT